MEAVDPQIRRDFYDNLIWVFSKTSPSSRQLRKIMRLLDEAKKEAEQSKSGDGRPSKKEKECIVNVSTEFSMFKREFERINRSLKTPIDEDLFWELPQRLKTAIGENPDESFSALRQIEMYLNR